MSSHGDRRRRARALRLRLAALLVLGAGLIAFGTAGGGGSGAQPLDASRFAAGACEAFAPTVGNRHLTVFLDAGHGGRDPGAVGVTASGRQVLEADETLRVALDTLPLLRADGYRVVLSRTRDSTVLRLAPDDVSGGELTLLGAHDDVVARDVCANLAGASVLVGIYFDASSLPQTAGSLAAYDNARPFTAANQRIATLLERDVLAALNAHGWQIPDDGVDPDEGLGSISGSPAAGGLAAQAQAYDHLVLLGPAEPGYLTTPSEMPGAIIEPLYITDPFEGTIANSRAGQEAIAHGIAQAVRQFLSTSR